MASKIRGALGTCAVILGIASLSFGEASQPEVSSERAEVPKIEREGVWQPGPDGTQIPLWPAEFSLAKPDTGDHPEATGNGSTTVGGRRWHWASYVTRPTMTIYRPIGENTGVTMMVLPGGGFHAVALDLEGTEICDWVVRQGMTCVLLKYRVPQVWRRVNGVAQRPEVLLALEDAHRAMGLLRHRADQYNIDPAKIGVIGFSSGAYLAANLSNTDERTYRLSDAADQISPRPNFAVILYTARLWDESNGSTDLSLEPWVQVSPQAPPTLLMHAMDDPVDNVRHPMAYALALSRARVPVDMRLYAEGGHAFGLRSSEHPITTQWPGQVRQWLENIGILPQRESV
ncbi:MAG: alpha/beta hydrolase [Rhodospirillales bacterium]|nr:alpha/beta hydrolase [Rhodospirillales bacterium]